MSPAWNRRIRSVTEVSGHEYARTYDCRRAGCTGEATARSGRNSYCYRCRIERGTMTADGRPTGKLNGHTNGEVPIRTTAKSTNGSDPSPEDAPERITRGNEFAITAVQGNGHAPDDVDRATCGGPFETRSLELVHAGRELDAALAAYTDLKPRIAAALQAWREALQQLPDATNGHAPDLENVAQ
jgi:hypothetical protein